MSRERERRRLEEVALYATLVSSLITILSVPRVFPEVWHMIGEISLGRIFTSTEESVNTEQSKIPKVLATNTGPGNGASTESGKQSAPVGFTAGLWGGTSGVFLLPFRGLPPYTESNTGWMYHYPGFLVGSFLMAFLCIICVAVSDTLLDGKLAEAFVNSFAVAAGVYFLWFISLFPIFLFGA